MPKPSLHLAARAGDLALTKRLAAGSGADGTDGRDEDGRTPLMLASRHHHDDVVEYLLSRGADASLRDNNGRTALDLAHEGLNGSEFWKRDAKTFSLLKAALARQQAEEEAAARQEVLDALEKGAPLMAGVKRRPPIRFG